MRRLKVLIEFHILYSMFIMIPFEIRGFCGIEFFAAIVNKTKHQRIYDENMLLKRISTVSAHGFELMFFYRKKRYETMSMVISIHRYFVEM